MADSIHVKYLIASEQDILWGITVHTVGYQHVEANMPYPPQNHPTRYLFSTHKGRVLEEYQLLYITEGNGDFLSASQMQTELKAGNMFLLFPGEWHNYAPKKAVGWTEYWIGFKGANIDNRVLNGFLSKQKPIFNVGIREDIIQLYKQAIYIATEQRTGFQQMLAGIVNYLLGVAYSQDKYSSFEHPEVINQINKAKIIMIDNFQTGITANEVANRLYMSYSWFRRNFKQYTGLSPHRYIQELRMQKSKELLTNTLLTSQEIAFDVGFENSDYFCTAFKKNTGFSPIKYREFTQEKKA